MRWRSWLQSLNKSSINPQQLPGSYQHQLAGIQEVFRVHGLFDRYKRRVIAVAGNLSQQFRFQLSNAMFSRYGTAATENGLVHQGIEQILVLFEKL